MYYYRIFISKAVQTVQREELNLLFNQSKALVAKHGITGVLACVQGMFGTHHETHFMQVLEGVKPEVEKISGAIMQNSIYGNLRLLAEAAVKKKNFNNWRVAFECIDLEEHQELKTFFQLDDAVLKHKEFQESNLLLDFLNEFQHYSY